MSTCSTFLAPAIVAYTVSAVSAFLTYIHFGTVTAFFKTAFADICTFSTTRSAIADINTVSAVVTVFAPKLSRAIGTKTAFCTDKSRTVFAILCTSFADSGAFRTTVTTVADIFNTVNAHFTACAEVAFTAYTINTRTTVSADVFGLTVCAFFVTFGTYGCTVVTALSADTHSTAFATDIAV